MINEEMLAEARRAHDTDLRGRSDEVATAVLAGRERAERQIRLTLARTYGRDGLATSSRWEVLPCLTDAGTLGIIDIAKGTAWDTGVVADSGVHDLGVDSEVYGAANGGQGDVRLEGKVVQSNGATPGAPLRMPAGWRQIALPTWRRGAVRTTDYKPDTWIRPRLVEAGLMTCYGQSGDCRVLHDTHGWDAQWPWGVPEWITGTSVTVLDAMIGAGRSTISDGPPMTRRPRGTEQEEMSLVQALIARASQLVPGALRLTARAAEWGADGAMDLVRQLRELADRADHGDDVLGEAQPILRQVERLSRRKDKGESDYSSRAVDADNLVTAISKAREADCAWDAASALGMCGRVTELLVGEAA